MEGRIVAVHHCLGARRPNVRGCRQSDRQRHRWAHRRRRGPDRYIQLQIYGSFPVIVVEHRSRRMVMRYCVEREVRVNRVRRVMRCAVVIRMGMDERQRHRGCLEHHGEHDRDEAADHTFILSGTSDAVKGSSGTSYNSRGAARM